MTLIRHKQRLVHKQIVNQLRDGLTQMNWVTAPIIFSATPITLIDFQPDERGKAIAPNTVAVSMGDEDEDEAYELGANLGGVQAVEIPLFVDVYGEERSISTALCADIKYLLKNTVAPLLSWDGTDTGATLEIDTVQGPLTPPEAASAGAESFKRHWRVVKAATFTYFNE